MHDERSLTDHVVAEPPVPDGRVIIVGIWEDGREYLLDWQGKLNWIPKDKSWPRLPPGSFPVRIVDIALDDIRTGDGIYDWHGWQMEKGK